MKDSRREIEWARPGTHLLGRWNDRGRSALTAEQIAEQEAQARQQYEAAMRERPAKAPEPLN